MHFWWYSDCMDGRESLQLYFYKISFYFLSGPVKEQPFLDRSLTELVEYGMLLPQTLDYLLLAL